MPDFDATAAAIAARYAPAQVTPPAGMQNVRLATSDPPQAIASGRSLFRPVVIVFPDEGEFEMGGGTRLGQARFKVRFYLAVSTDIAREVAALRKWLTVLVDVHKTSNQLGGLVVVVRTMAWRLRLLPYGRLTYAGIELDVTAITSESWLPTS